MGNPPLERKSIEKKESHEHPSELQQTREAMGLGSYSIMMKGESKEHHFQVKKEAVQDAQRMGTKPSARKWNIARNTMRTWLRRFENPHFHDLYLLDFDSGHFELFLKMIVMQNS